MLGALISVIAVLSVASCGDDHLTPTSASTTAPAMTAPSTSLLPERDVVVVQWVETGGCMVLGPNCPTWTITADGTVEVSRTLVRPDVDPSVQGTGSLNPSLLRAVVREARDVDAATLLAQLGPGACNACVDGSDIVVTITVGGRPLVLDSVDVLFAPDYPLFVALGELMAVARLVELPVVVAD